MNINVSGRHMEITDGLREHIENGLNKLANHFDKVIDADVVLDVQKSRHIAEINLSANGVRLNAQQESTDMYVSVDGVIEKLERQAKKYKDRLNRHQARSTKEAWQFREVVPELESETATATETASEHPEVVKEEITMRPMTLDEAVTQLDIIEDQFLVFSNVQTSRVNVLYRRNDGMFGLLDPRF